MREILLAVLVLALFSCSLSWDGSFAPLIANPQSFCNDYGFGMNKPYICAGGGSSGPGGNCEKSACTSGQYTFSTQNGWKINIPHSLAKGKAPYRAFAYVPFCDGSQIRSCWGTTQTQTFSFQFKTENLAAWTSYVKFLFWTDSSNILGFIPPQAPSAKNKTLTLVFFPQDDWPNNWMTDMPLEDNRLYSASVTFTPGSGTMTKVSIDGKMIAQKALPVNILSDSNGPQIGAYQFDFQSINPTVDYFNIYLQNLKLGPATSDHDEVLE